jgi:outer membrane biosynthesis protein TonB
MNLRCQFVAVLLVASVLLSGVGCEKKKPKLPPQAKAPAEPISTPLPDQITETAPPPPPPATPPPQTTAQEQPQQKPPKRRVPKKKPSSTASAQNAAPVTTQQQPAPSNSTTIAMSHPPSNPAAEAPPDPAIAADVSSAQLNRQKQSTAQLIDETEKNISGLKGLSGNEEEMLAQIRSYVSQSRKATTDGDFERAYNLANKAHLLADALLKK